MTELSCGTILKICQDGEKKQKKNPILQILSIKKEGYSKFFIELSDGVYSHKHGRVGHRISHCFTSKTPKVKESGVIELLEYKCIKNSYGVKLIFLEDIKIVKDEVTSGQIGDPIELDDDGTVPGGASPSNPKKKDNKKDKPVSKTDSATSDINPNTCLPIGGSTFLDFGSVESAMSRNTPKRYASDEGTPKRPESKFLKNVKDRSSRSLSDAECKNSPKHKKGMPIPGMPRDSGISKLALNEVKQTTTAIQNSKIDQFVQITNASEMLAEFYLHDRNWDLESSITAFYESNKSPKPGSSSKISHVSNSAIEKKSESKPVYSPIEKSKAGTSSTSSQQIEHASSSATNLEELQKRQAALQEMLRKCMSEKNQMFEPEVVKTNLHDDIWNGFLSNQTPQFSPIKPISRISPIKRIPGQSPFIEEVVTVDEDDEPSADPKFLEMKRRVENLRRVVGLKNKKIQSLKSEIKSDKQKFKSRTETIINKSEEESKCFVCMEQFGSTVLDRVVRAKIITPCCHVMCSKCYDDHVNGIVGYNKWCPTCRKPITNSFTLQGDCNLEHLGLVVFNELKKRGI